MKLKNCEKSRVREKLRRQPIDCSLQKSRFIAGGGFFVSLYHPPTPQQTSKTGYFSPPHGNLFFYPSRQVSGFGNVYSGKGNLLFCLSRQAYGKGNHRYFLRDYFAGKGNIYHGKGNHLFCLYQQAAGKGNHRDFLRDLFAGKGNIYDGKGNLPSDQSRQVSGQKEKRAGSGVGRGIWRNLFSKSNFFQKIKTT